MEHQPSSQPPKLLDQVRARLRTLHYSIRTEEAYANWITRFILFHHKRHPRDMGGPEVEAFLTHLAVEGQVAASTQNQALAALLFLYQQVLEMELPRLDAVRAKRPERLPVVLSRDEVRAVLDGMAGSYRLMAGLMYGSGLRLLECCRLRVKDIDFARRQITVREGKGDKDRAVPLPRSLEPGLQRQVEHVQELHPMEYQPLSQAPKLLEQVRGCTGMPCDAMRSGGREFQLGDRRERGSAKRNWRGAGW
jgi:integrase